MILQTQPGWLQLVVGLEDLFIIIGTNSWIVAYQELLPGP